MAVIASAQQSNSSTTLESHATDARLSDGAVWRGLLQRVHARRCRAYARLEKDVALMKAAGLNVVRMGESTWSLWEPEDGHFEYAWMDHIVDAMGKAGIKVILGTPTYSIPAWMAHQHPEILADRIPGGTFGGKPVAQRLRHAPEHGHRLAGVPLLRRAADPPHRRALQGQSDGDRMAARQRDVAATTPPIAMCSSDSSTISKRSS